MVNKIKYIINSIIIGIISVIVINLIGQFFNFKLPFTLLSILLIGFLRIPGFIILLIYLIL
ncbi:MAG: pro-sigmaK processing inhibitor BofA family protein [Anaeroplasma sp.]